MLDRDRIFSCLSKLREKDPKLKVFGANVHRYELDPVVPEQQVVDFEAELGVTLPEEYQYFLTEISGGGSGPDYGIIRFTRLRLDAHTFKKTVGKPFPLTQPWCPSFPMDSEEYEDLLERYDVGRIPISPRGCGYTSELIVTGEVRGQFWVDFTAGDEGVRPVAQSFDKWYMDWLNNGLRGKLLITR